MGGMATAAATVPQRRGPQSGLAAGILAMARGPLLFALMLPGLGLLILPLLTPVLGVLGIYIVTAGGGTHGFRNMLAAVVIWAVDVAIWRYLMPPGLMAMRRLANLTRRLSGDWCGVPIAEPYREGGEGAAGRGRQRLAWLLSDPATWRDMLWMAANACVGWVLAMVPVTLAAYGLIRWVIPYAAGPPQWAGATRVVLIALGLAVLAVAVLAAPWLLYLYGGLARSLLGPRGQAELTLRVRHLAQTRSETIDAGAAEIRRIERDLHDGAQARLVAMGMTLSVAHDLLATSPEAAGRLVLEARDASAKALAELRILVRGIHPPVLADRGLADAIRALALDTCLNVTVTADLPGRPPAPVESAGYFVVSELLANVAKHAGADRTWIDIRYSAGMMRIGVTDNGCGGADPRAGTGLRGIERRLAAFDGVLAISSPVGGPTEMNMEIPCALS